MALSSQDGHVAAKAEICGDADDVFVDRNRAKGGEVDPWKEKAGQFGRSTTERLRNRNA
jgi:hypothetical protein